jgi:MFS family permease
VTPQPKPSFDPATTALATAERQALHRRSLTVVAVSQVFGGAGLAAGVTFGALLAQEMLGTAALAGLPTALFTLGSALTALLVGRLSSRSGRRAGLTAGFLAGALGAIGIVVAAALGSPVLLFPALVVYGAGTATTLQARYAGTDLAPESRRATAVSIVLVATTVGAVAGPNLVVPTGRLAAGLGLPVLAGPFLLAAAAYLVAAAVLFGFLRPDPSLVAAALNRPQPASPTPTPTTTPTVRPRGLVLGASVMALTSAAMAAIMTMTPVHMREHDHSLAAVGFVIGVHIGAMYLPSLLTGWLVDVAGRLPMAVAAALVLLASGLVAALPSGGSLVGATLALALLGLGWNIGLISGSALVVDATTAADRARTQGSLDVFVALAAAAGGALSGLVVVGAGYPALSLGGGVLALAVLPLVAWAKRAETAAR